MTTPALNAANAAQFASVTDLAGMLGVDKAVVSRKVKRFEASGALEATPAAPGRQKLVNVAAYLAAADQSIDAIRALNGAFAQAEPAAELGASPILAKEQARRVAIQADLAQIELDTARGTLVQVGDVRDAMARAAGELVRGLDGLTARADDFASAVASGGVPGLRSALKEAIRELRERLAAEMTLLAADKPDGDA